MGDDHATERARAKSWDKEAANEICYGIMRSVRMEFRGVFRELHAQMAMHCLWLDL